MSKLDLRPGVQIVDESVPALDARAVAQMIQNLEGVQACQVVDNLRIEVVLSARDPAVREEILDLARNYAEGCHPLGYRLTVTRVDAPTPPPAPPTPWHAQHYFGKKDTP